MQVDTAVLHTEQFFEQGFELFDDVALLSVGINGNERHIHGKTYAYVFEIVDIDEVFLVFVAYHVASGVVVVLVRLVEKVALGYEIGITLFEVVIDEEVLSFVVNEFYSAEFVLFVAELQVGKRRYHRAYIFNFRQRSE